MIVGVPTESISGENRVAQTPETVKQLVEMGLKVQVHKGAGVAAGYPDKDYQEAGASLVATLNLEKVDVLTHVRPLTTAVVNKLPAGTITVGLGSPASEGPVVKALAKKKVTSFALELVPRISRAQSMDALTSQALVAGYRCVLEAAMRFPRFFPLYMTAAGTVPPANVLVLGAGVAGLQAIATAKRLGAKVQAYDVRAASADEVRSMGGQFIELDLDAQADGQGGYAKELSSDRQERQQELLTPYVTQADVIITTAAIPGRPAPRLITKKMMADMKPGSVIIDLAAETGGNVEGAVAGADTPVKVQGGKGHATLVGMKDVPSTMAYDASRLYAKNIANLLALMNVDGAIAPDFDDEVVAGACLTHDGDIRHEPTREALASPKKGA
ncbi:Re/Si-specific NAD(P)(+) transhydrogenase subunit alpha [Pontimonas sp.]|jgi:NAD(P) transhydrogenase subunit alpha|uniref:Re/Si-specific NAD(P)(+) transhydrogenase subunit alpha n=1 Tax=Pontimonas sp. TaxID=2304492 RepID=UPI00286FC3B1|nr:Re/Si-specific NAD(P)(+) transhydrogenase subunit alpha [Pontimonas sp.]MDR9396406.1 Re/Si-specific NAD(P)(+) transhydrogenase subunit alpha [Pontimonas sp.]MDR9434776.1 Re/Si-specific NAD(P)(+) transhydrogenase subunit alpha [Pontimonas sp.]